MTRTIDSGTPAMDVDFHAGAARSCQSPDEELRAVLLQVRAGSRDAFELLFAMTSGRLFESVSQIKPDRLEAEAVLQEVFVNIWHEASYFDANQDDATQWLLALTRRTALNCMRHRAQSGESSTRSDARTYATPGTDLPEPVNIVVRGAGPRPSSPNSDDL